MIDLWQPKHAAMRISRLMAAAALILCILAIGTGDLAQIALGAAGAIVAAAVSIGFYRIATEPIR